MKTQIPIYRAKKIDSDKYVEGYLEEEFLKYTKGDKNIQDKYEVTDVWYSISSKSGWNYDIVDISTLAIHFPDMIDSEGNKIFASLSEDGKGGDIIHNQEAPDNFDDMLVRMGRRKVAVVCDELGEPHYLSKNEWSGYKVTGIQQ